MKNILAIIIFLLAANVYSKDIPTPFWYSISQKILAETQELIIKDDRVAEPTRAKAIKKEKPATVRLRCEQQKDPIQLPFFTLKTNPLWNNME